MKFTFRTMTIGAVLPAAVIAAGQFQSAALAQSDQQTVEISKDGLLCHYGDAEDQPPRSTAGGGAESGTPFGTQPDWVNTLRRQIAAVRIADVDGDGHNDLVAVCYQSNSFPPYEDWRNMIYFGTGNGLEAQPSWISTDQVHSGDIAIADFNNDGHKDIFCANGGSAHSPSVIYWGTAFGPNPAPGWASTTPTSGWALSAVAVDFDHDGDIDVVTSNQSAIQNDNFRPLYLFRNNNGVLPTSPAWQSQDTMISNGIAVADVDGDGWEDIAAAKWVNFQSGVYKNINGTPTGLPVWNNGATNGGRGAAIGDVDGDGVPDLIFGYGAARMYRNNGDGKFTQTWQATPLFTGLQELKLVDIEGDGDLDVVETHFSDGRTHVYVNANGVLPTIPSWSYDSVPLGNAIDVGDVNGDGCPDLAIGYSGEPSLAVFYGRCAKPEPCVGDVSPPGPPIGDGQVNVSDLLAVINAWGPCAGCAADTNGDDEVNVTDLLAIINNWGACP